MWSLKIMKISIKDIREEECVCDALILPFTEGNSGRYDRLHPSISKAIKKAFSKEFSGKQNEVLLVPAPEDMKPERICLAGLGKKAGISPEKIRQAGGKALAGLRDKGIKKVALSAEYFSTLNISPVNFVEGALLGLYTFRKYQKEKDIREIDALYILSKTSKKLADELSMAKTVASSVCFARDLVNTPANDMTPADLAKAALTLKKKNLAVTVLERKDIEKLGMFSYLSVAGGSNQPLKFILLEYKGSTKDAIVLIGKAITFDSGGLSIKPSDGMEKMKYDMAGGAAVLGIMKAVSELDLPVHLIGILPATENLPGGSASRPGDVVRAIDGKTIEIISTDAEGRMTLADAIGYAKRYKPKAIIDIATLTGACSIALGNVVIAMMGNSKEMLERMKQSGDSVHERVWEMPLYEEYKEYIKSDIADLKNSGGRQGSLSASACFLHEFAGDTPWVHLDIAGTAYIDKDKPYIPKGATGIGVRLLFNLINNFK